MGNTLITSFLKKNGFNTRPYHLHNTTILLGEIVRYKAADIAFSYDEITQILNIAQLSSIEKTTSLSNAMVSAIKFIDWVITEVEEIEKVTTLISQNFLAENGSFSNEEHANLYKKHLGATSLGYDEMMGGEMLTLDTAEYRKRKAKK